MDKKINLIDGGIQHSNLFLHMPLFDEISYEGFAEGKVRKYRAIREDQPCQILVLNVIRHEEKIIWDALEDLIKRSVKEAGFGVRGTYVFDLLTMDIHKEVKTYKPHEFTTTIINHSQKMTPGQTRLFKYSTCYALLQKLGQTDWGKTILKTAVEIFKDKPVFLDLLVKQLLKKFEYSHEPSILLLNDLSQEPLFDCNDSKQQERLQKVLEDQIPTTIEYLPEVYIQDRNGVRELLSNSVIQ